MSKSCVVSPSRGKKQFEKLKKDLGYEKAKEVFLQAINPDFINDYRDTLILDNEGVPTINSILSNPYLQQIIGEDNNIILQDNSFQPMQDNLENFETVLEQCHEFNTKSPLRDKMIATLEYDGDKIKTKINKRTKEKEDKYNNQYSSFLLNRRLSDIFGNIGVTVGMLYDYEFQAGRAGVTDFSKVKTMANDFSQVVRVANNYEGAMALSEEFSHLIIGLFKDDIKIQRAINAIAQNDELLMAILQDEYNSTKIFFNGNKLLMAEEALGQILQNHLLSRNGVGDYSILDRTLFYLQSQFEDYDFLEIEQAIIEADQTMEELSKNILQGTVSPTQEQLAGSERDVQFNRLSTRIDRNLDILKSGVQVESKKYKISQKQDKKEKIRDTIAKLNKYIKDRDTVAGICDYGSYINSQMQRMNRWLTDINNFSTDKQFSILRETRQHIASCQEFIDSVNQAILADQEEIQESLRLHGKIEEEEDKEWLTQKISFLDDDGNITELSVQEVVNQMVQLQKQLSQKFVYYAMPLFCKFITPFVPKGLVDKAGQEITAETLMKVAEKDISFFDRWLDPMSASQSMILQVFDSIVQQYKGDARLDTIKDIREIQSLMKEFDEAGIRDYEWLFEKDRNGNKSGNYISEINYAEFQLDYNEKIKELKDKYGTNPTGDKAKEYLKELNAWRSIHCEGKFGFRPNKNYYRNKDFDNLSDREKELYNKFISIKSKLDQNYNIVKEGLVKGLSCIQIRKGAFQRFADSVKSPQALWENIKQLEKERFLDQSDDNQQFGEVTRNTLVDFDGSEFMVIPALYVTKLENPNEISTDIFSTLMSYAYSSNNYKQLNKIVDQLEIGRTLIKENLEVQQTRGANKVVEKFKVLGNTVNKNIIIQNSNIAEKLNDFLECQVYGRYLKDHGTLFNTNINTNKVVSEILRRSSLANLGFNWLANLANIATGKAMQRIEAASGEFFNYKELIQADKIFAQEMMNYTTDIGKRVKTSKLALFDQLFNVRQTFDQQVKRQQHSNLLKRIFGEQIAYLGQDAGDHWLYNRTAIACALREKVIKDGKEMSLWEALEVTEDGNGVKMIDTSSIKNLDGTEFDINKFSLYIKDINQSLFGVYNTDDMNAANRVAIGRLLLQYRKWIKPQMNKRFMAKQYNINLGKEQEGYYRTLVRVINECIRGKIQLGEVWQQTFNYSPSQTQLKDYEVANIRRSLFEIFQYLAVWALASLVQWPDDKDRPWALKLAEYMAKREMHELGGLTPIPAKRGMIQETIKTVKTPVPALSSINNMVNLGVSLITPSDYANELQSGPYKGMSTLHKNFLKAPLYGVAQIEQIGKFVGELDTSISYYARPW